MTRGSGRSAVDPSESTEVSVLKQEIAEAYFRIDQVQSQITAVQEKVEKMEDIPRKIDNMEGMMKTLMMQLGLLTVDPPSSSSRNYNKNAEVVTKEQEIGRTELEK